uniref:Uncharacterized protein n=1 Tax=Medicago truncatula TaxID=3880 RepID=A2Q614_MEDTR|nr:hypothetical protein MtrDRAFT_AC172742g28v1 [Medicago truncatula]
MENIFELKRSIGKFKNLEDNIKKGQEEVKDLIRRCIKPYTLIRTSYDGFKLRRKQVKKDM